MFSNMDQKRKISQTDLRALMQEKKRKLTEAKRKIDSPLAKYPFIHYLLVFMKFVKFFLKNYDCI